MDEFARQLLADEDGDFDVNATASGEYEKEEENEAPVEDEKLPGATSSSLTREKVGPSFSDLPFSSHVIQRQSAPGVAPGRFRVASLATPIFVPRFHSQGQPHPHPIAFFTVAT